MFIYSILSRSFKSVQSIKNYVSGVRNLHLLHGYEFPDNDNFELRLLLGSVSRISPHTPKRVLPITPDLLHKIYQHLNIEEPYYRAKRCSFLFAFFLMARKSSIIPPSITKFDKTKHLCRKDIVLHNNCLLVTIKYSKTIQFGERLVTLPLLPLHGSCLCPIQNYLRLCKLVPTNPEAPAFTYSNGSGIKTVTFSSFTSVLYDTLQRAGIETNNYSEHSFRRGGATWAFKAHVSGELIQIFGDWASDAYKLYIDSSLEAKLTVSSQINKSIQEQFTTQKVQKNTVM